MSGTDDRDERDERYWELVRRSVDQAPPLTPERLQRLTLLWRPGAVIMHKALREREAAPRRRS